MHVICIMTLPSPAVIKALAARHGFVERREEASSTLFFKSDNLPQSQHPTLINVFYTTGGIMTKLHILQVGIINYGEVMPMIRLPLSVQSLLIPEFIQDKGTVMQVVQREAVSDVECKRRRRITAKINGARVPVMQNVRIVFSRRAIAISWDRKWYLLFMIVFVPVIFFGIQSMILSPVMLKVAQMCLQQFDVNVVHLCTTVQRFANTVICWDIRKIAEVFMSFAT